MRMSCFLIVAGVLLLPLQAMAQSGSAGGSGSGTGGVTTGTAGSGTTPPGITASPPGSPNLAMPGPPGTNSLGTAQSSGRGAATSWTAGNTAEDEKIRAEDQVDKKIKSICKGC